ncbi:MAG: glycosyltransferase [Pseudomonadota bacterium]|nr:glycosyltransferase [Pseudomonadota bacterium]
MKSLWLTTNFLHPMNRGGKIRTYNILKEIYREDEVTYLGFDALIAGEEPLKRVAEYCSRAVAVTHREAERGQAAFFAQLAGNLFSSLPYSVAKLRSLQIEAKCEQELRHSDLDYLVCDFVHAAVNLPADLRIPSLLFQHNVEAVIWERLYQQQASPLRRKYYEMQWRRMFNFERSACRRFDTVIAVSENDAKKMRTDYGLSHVTAIPTAVDTDYFRPDPDVMRDPNTLVFTGSLDWTPNIDGLRWFVDSVLPIVARAVPNVKLKVVGRNPRPDLLAAIKGRRGVELVGRVADVRPHVQGATASVVPLLVGGGTRMKIFESLALETPVVSTTIGAEGLPLEPGKHILIADTAEDFARKTSKLLSDQAIGAALGLEGGNYVREKFGAATVAREFASICHATVERVRTARHIVQG